jgi:hypothetical protein
MKLFASLCMSLGLALSGCASTEAKATPTTQSQAQPATTAADPQAQCREVLVRARACTDDFIPALVDARAKLDTPAGIADSVKADRASVIAQAKTEWANDSKDDAIAATCSHATAEDSSAVDCVSKDCAAFVACVMPTFEKHLQK